MATVYETLTVGGDGITLPLLLWRRFRRPVPGLIEQALDANPGLAALGPVLPVGTVVSIPIPEAPEETEATLQPITLW
jgi:phage tail protein X